MKMNEILRKKLEENKGQHVFFEQADRFPSILISETTTFLNVSLLIAIFCQKNRNYIFEELGESGSQTSNATFNRISNSYRMCNFQLNEVGNNT